MDMDNTLIILHFLRFPNIPLIFQNLLAQNKPNILTRPTLNLLLVNICFFKTWMLMGLMGKWEVY